MNKQIKQIIDNKILNLFEKPPQKKYDPAFTKEQNKLRYEIMLDAMGLSGLGWEGDPFSLEELAITREWLRSKANSIEGGTTEINLNIISKRVLNLPD